MFEKDGAKLLSRIASDSAAARKFDFDGAYPFLDMLRGQAAGRIGGWDIRWSASILLSKGLTLYPAQSLVKNIGFDGSGIHCDESGNFDTDLSATPVLDFPEYVDEDPQFLSDLRRHFLASRGSIPTRIWRYAGRQLRRRFA